MGTILLPGGAGKYVIGVDPACPWCQEPLTEPHMLLHCQNHKVQRDHLEAALHSHGLVLNLSNVLDQREQLGARSSLPSPNTFWTVR
ncbi:hypothetical protein DPMN_159321 [Dreissena polymorpha]|uniref:Uncharacterized protein n=1 Tax=Dreissena polymorpha TaxID=45954 RepID=A0A9D4IMS6_DREPO|nr:hypothetical protein DPMN_159321 [Dreissena polymorpha]